MSTASDALLRTAMIRERCGNITAAATAGESRHFRIDRARLPAAAALVADVTRRRYPDLAIPYHSRWRHFEAGGIDRRAELELALADRAPTERARSHIDLAVVSVLLDAGAGPAWGYVEAESGQRFTRSEGLGVASFHAFMRGAFSATADDPVRVDAAALAAIDAGRLAELLQATPSNPLVGLDGRAALLRRLGHSLTERHKVFGDQARPGALFDALVPNSGNDREQHDPRNGNVTAVGILGALLAGLNSIWLTGSELNGVALGDAWQHRLAGGVGESAGWVPFHKLTQWLAYSLLEPFEWARITVTGRDELTALPEYRNGGLLLDTGVIALLDPDDAFKARAAGDELVVEWRALTVTLIDELAPLVRAALDSPDLPLACILEGGTWAAGRELAQQLRNGTPPLNIISDGTVF